MRHRRSRTVGHGALDRPPEGSASSAAQSAIPDVLGRQLRVLFCGINPGHVSAAARAHFANPRNDFWRLLHVACFTPRPLAPTEQWEALEYGVGITNAAYKTTAGSGDLRRGDFAGSAARLEQYARELEPSWIGFVGKEAYRGTFGERPELGVQARTLGSTRLFVLPSTSPANAAVPWDTRLRWFQELAGRSTGQGLRPAARALVVDKGDRVLLVRFQWPNTSVWAPPGGGLEGDESYEEAIVRELAEESGLRDFELGPWVWSRAHWFADMAGWGGQEERVYLIHVEKFEPEPDWSSEQLAAEGIAEQRWWTLEELEAANEPFSPSGLPELVRRLLRDGPPARPHDVGV
jgi:TDG/mug DNA glycosylase family protein